MSDYFDYDSFNHVTIEDAEFNDFGVLPRIFVTYAGEDVESSKGLFSNADAILMAAAGFRDSESLMSMPSLGSLKKHLTPGEDIDRVVRSKR